jgi:hypothetical protein
VIEDRSEKPVRADAGRAEDGATLAEDMEEEHAPADAGRAEDGAPLTEDMAEGHVPADAGRAEDGTPLVEDVAEEPSACATCLLGGAARAEAGLRGETRSRVGGDAGVSGNQRERSALLGNSWSSSCVVAERPSLTICCRSLMRLFELPRPAFELLKRRKLFFRSSASPSDAVASALLWRDFISPGAENADAPSEQARLERWKLRCTGCVHTTVAVRTEVYSRHRQWA